MSEVDWEASEIETEREKVFAYRNLPPENRESFELTLYTVQRAGDLLLWASPDLQNNKEIVMAAVTENGSAIAYAGDDMRADKDVALAAVQNRPDAIIHLDERMRDDEEVVLLAAHRQENMAYASERLRTDKKFMRKCISQNGSGILAFAPDTIRNDREIIVAGILKSGHALKYAGEKIRDDKDIVFLAVQKNGSELAYASERMRDDKEVVMAAVAQQGFALQHASERLRDDEVIVSMAMMQNPSALGLASKRIQNNPSLLPDYSIESRLVAASNRKHEFDSILVSELINYCIKNDVTIPSEEDFYAGRSFLEELSFSETDMKKIMSITNAAEDRAINSCDFQCREKSEGVITVEDRHGILLDHYLRMLYEEKQPHIDHTVQAASRLKGLVKTKPIVRINKPTGKGLER